MRLFVFEKNKLVFGYRFFTRFTPKMTNPLKKKPMLKSSHNRSTPKQRQTHVQKLKIIKKPYVRQTILRKKNTQLKKKTKPQKLVTQNQTPVPN